MENTDLVPLIDDLSANIDDLEEALEPLLKGPLRDTSSKLPLLDKAKLNVLATYAIESIIFSYLNLSSVNAKEHPVFSELSRVKEYFAKIKLAEEGLVKRPGNRTLDTSAANRFIKHGLSGNEQYDKERVARQEREKASAKIKFDQLSEKAEMQRLEKKRKAEELAERQEGPEGDSSSDSSSSEESDTEETKLQKEKKELKKAFHKPNKKALREMRIEAHNYNPDRRSETAPGPVPRKSKSDKAPRGHSEAFQALLNKPATPKKEVDEAASKKDSSSNPKAEKHQDANNVKTHKKKKKGSKKAKTGT